MGRRVRSRRSWPSTPWLVTSLLVGVLCAWSGGEHRVLADSAPEPPTRSVQRTPLPTRTLADLQVLEKKIQAAVKKAAPATVSVQVGGRRSRSIAFGSGVSFQYQIVFSGLLWSYRITMKIFHSQQGVLCGGWLIMIE